MLSRLGVSWAARPAAALVSWLNSFRLAGDDNGAYVLLFAPADDLLKKMLFRTLAVTTAVLAFAPSATAQSTDELLNSLIIGRRCIQGVSNLVGTDFATCASLGNLFPVVTASASLVEPSASTWMETSQKRGLIFPFSRYRNAVALPGCFTRCYSRELPRPLEPVVGPPALTENLHFSSSIISTRTRTSVPSAGNPTVRRRR